MGVIFDVTKKEKFVYSGRNSEGKFAIATQISTIIFVTDIIVEMESATLVTSY